MAKEIVKKEAKILIAVKRYFKETIGELRKVSWPSRDEATYLTTVVIVVIIALSSFLAIFDIIFSWLFAFVLRTQ